MIFGGYDQNIVDKATPEPSDNHNKRRRLAYNDWLSSILGNDKSDEELD